jgi:hypothetical protein
VKTHIHLKKGAVRSIFLNRFRFLILLDKLTLHMKKLLILTVCLLPARYFTQVLTPISLTGFNLDAIAEATTSLANTGGAIDGSNYVMYSAAYGTVYSTGTGLPNNGLVTSSTRTYQLEPYNQNNMLFLLAGQMDSLTLSNPASFAAIGMLAFATEGTGSMNITLRFTDNSTQVLSNQSMPDWYGTGSAIISGFDRCNRTTGTPNNQSTNPKMFSLDIPVTCANRSKQVSRVLVQNTGTNARLCVMALSGAGMPSYSTSVTPVSCAGGYNGSATISTTGGFPPFTFTVSSTPVQTSGTPGNLPTGAYSYTAQDVSNCPVTGTFAISQSLTAQPDLTVTASSGTICAGKTITLTAQGAATYTWNTSTSGNTEVVQPPVSTLYYVAGVTSQNCLRSGTIDITVNPLPQVSFSMTPDDQCIGDAMFPLSGSPVGGFYSGAGVQGNSYNPALAGVGTHTVKYFYTDQNTCTNSAVQSISVYSLAPPAVLSGSAVCLNAPAFQVTVSPTGGTFSGIGVSQTGMITTTASGVFAFTYSITDGPCEAIVPSAFTIMPLPTVALIPNKTVFCLTSSQGVLSASPPGGIFGGNGVNNFLFTPTVAGVGSHTLSYTFTNTSTKCVNAAYAVVKVNDCSGITEQVSRDFSFFPNPNEGRFTLVSNRSQTLYLTNALGQILLEIKTDANSATEVNIPDNIKGILFLRNAEGNFRQKVVVR